MRPATVVSLAVLAAAGLYAQAEAPLEVKIGTRIPVSLINSVSTKHSSEGDRVYMETVFPILVNGTIVIPPGSYVSGTLTQVKRPGRVKGKGELFLRFDSLTLPNGVTRDFRASLSGVDGRGNETLERKEGKVQGDSNVGGDMRTVGETAAGGASLGAIVGAASKSVGKGIGIGAGAGAAAGLMGVLLSRGPDAVLAKGSTIEMVLDRPIAFERSELNFGGGQAGHFSDGPGPQQKKDASVMRRRLPF